MVAKHQATRVLKYIAVINNVVNVSAVITEMNTKVALIQVFSSRRTPRNLFILTLFLDYVVNIFLDAFDVYKTFLSLKILVLLHDDIMRF